MRTTVRLNQSLLAAAKKRAAESGRTLTSVLEEALREPLQRRARVDRRAPVKLRTVKGAGVRPGVDLDDSASLLVTMES
ncbi:MAG TPA: hypothetical protein VNK91_09760 [Burkholderiaceae bacterium]|nr:hypothetical protein [Burkholderiaceae bacterium]